MAVSTQRESMQQDEAKPKVIVVSRRIDAFNTVRRAIPITPAHCDECGADLVLANREKFSADAFDELGDAEKATVRTLIREHKKVYHTAPTSDAQAKPARSVLAAE